MTSSLYIGVDPGKTNLGVGYLTEDGQFLSPQHLTPKNLGIAGTAAAIFDAVGDQPIAALCIERYVAYKNIMSPDAESILMVIGGIIGEAERRGIPVYAYRAIDWKIRLCKHLVRTREFSNPSDKLDKKFSFAAQICIAGRKTKTDHEADAECLAYYGRVVHEIAQREENRNQAAPETSEVAVEDGTPGEEPSAGPKRRTRSRSSKNNS